MPGRDDIIHSMIIIAALIIGFGIIVYELVMNH